MLLAIKYENEATLKQEELTSLYLLGFFVHFYVYSLCIEKHWLKKLKYSFSHRMMLLFPSDKSNFFFKVKQDETCSKVKPKWVVYLGLLKSGSKYKIFKCKTDMVQ